MTEDFISPEWQGALSQAGLGDFEALWALDAGWFEEPNERRGGWSGVSRYELALPDGTHAGLFIKRQKNHQTWSWRHPIRGRPTFAREFRHIQHYQACNVPSLEPIYFANRHDGKDSRAILITRELAGFDSMESCVNRWLTDGAPPKAERRRYLDSIALLLRHMHEHGIQHNCFFPKHVFVRAADDGAIEVRVIDLEKSRWRPAKTLCALRDMYTLVRHSLCWSLTDRVYFFRSYLGRERMDAYGKWLWRKIDRRARVKKRIHAVKAMLSPRQHHPA